MSDQVEVRSIDAIKDFRSALALYGEDVLAALAAADAEARRTSNWLQQDRPYFWQDQIKRRREMVAQAKADLFRLQLQKTPDHHPSMAEPKERLRKAEAALRDAEQRLIAVRKWQPALNQAVIEFHGSVQRLKDLGASDVPRAVALLARIIDSLEAYLQVQPPSVSDSISTSAARPAAYDAIIEQELDREVEDEPAAEGSESHG